MKVNVLLVSDQVRGIDGTGGLGDVATGLAQELARRDDIDIRIVMPGYQAISPSDKSNPFADIVIENLPVPLGNQVVSVRVCRYSVPRFNPDDPEVTCYLLVEPERFRIRENSAVQAALLSRAAIAFVQACEEFRPDVIHCNDWHTGLIPVYLNTLYQSDPFLGRIATVYTAHNNSGGAYQGAMSFQEVGPHINLPQECFHPGRTRSIEHHGQFNFAKGGFGFSDLLTTVSLSYARELRSIAFGGSLESVLSDRASDLCGIVNGIDTFEWDPENDHFLPKEGRFSANDSAETIRRKKLACRAALRDWIDPKTGINPYAELRDETHLIGVITRITEQKMPVLLPLLEDTGWQHVPAPLERIAREPGPIQFVILGNADPKDQRGQIYARRLEELRGEYPERITFFNGFSIELSHLIYAASELFLVPSLYEPCGLTQLTSMRYGSVPVVRSIGGLKDTVIDEQESHAANGFRFLEQTGDPESWWGMADVPRAAELLYQTIRRALGVKLTPRWNVLVRNGMMRDSSWKIPAAQYRRIYEAAVNRRLQSSFCETLATTETTQALAAQLGEITRLLTMPTTVFENLRKISWGNFGPFQLSEIFRQELVQLSDWGYVEKLDFDQLPEHGENLSHFVRVSDAGERFVHLRLSLQQQFRK